MEDLLGITLRVSVMYLYSLALLRLSGKRSIGDLTPLDFIVALIIGDMFDDVFWAEIPLSQGIVGISAIILLHMLQAYFSWKNTAFHHLITSMMTPVVQNGKFNDIGLRYERTRPETVMFELRLQGEDKMEEIEQASWEPSGQLSVLKLPEAKTVEKKDLSLLKEMFH